jgi:hypothetical protein
MVTSMVKIALLRLFEITMPEASNSNIHGYINGKNSPFKAL